MMYDAIKDAVDRAVAEANLPMPVFSGEPRTISQEIADFIATEGGGRCWDALVVVLTRLKAAQAEAAFYRQAWENAVAIIDMLPVDTQLALGRRVYPPDDDPTELTDDDLANATGGTNPTPDAGCRYAPMGGKCYPARVRLANWPQSLRAQRAERYNLR